MSAFTTLITLTALTSLTIVIVLVIWFDIVRRFTAGSVRYDMISVFVSEYQDIYQGKYKSK
jgi:hypothetical protein